MECHTQICEVSVFMVVYLSDSRFQTVNLKLASINPLYHSHSFEAWGINLEAVHFMNSVSVY
jgi:hypothetical protein